MVLRVKIQPKEIFIYSMYNFWAGLRGIGCIILTVLVIIAAAASEERLGTQVTNLVILIASFGMLFLTLNLYGQGSIGYDGVLTCTIAMMGSFGPVVALSSLSNNLNQTLASGERVLSILLKRNRRWRKLRASGRRRRSTSLVRMRSM